MAGGGRGGADSRARLMPFCSDLYGGRNSGLSPLSGMHVKVIPETSPGAADSICYVTWYHMGSFRTPGSATVFGVDSGALGPRERGRIADEVLGFLDRKSVV